MSRKEQAVTTAVKSAMDMVESAGAKIEEKVSRYSMIRYHLDNRQVRFESSSVPSASGLLENAFHAKEMPWRSLRGSMSLNIEEIPCRITSP